MFIFSILPLCNRYCLQAVASLSFSKSSEWREMNDAAPIVDLIYPLVVPFVLHRRC